MSGREPAPAERLVGCTGVVEPIGPVLAVAVSLPCESSTPPWDPFLVLPAFPAAFPWFESPRHWEGVIVQLQEQLVAMREPVLELPRG